jgi:ATP-dependent exoDNAse (exonuclease V) beta subunit
MSAEAVAPPADEAARARIRTILGETLFVEAGAGSGKTSALVGRVVQLVTEGVAPLESIAAITFTEKAGAELRDRIRQELEKRQSSAPDRETVRRCREAIDQLDGAAIGTLHAFAQRILMENPVEARLPPRIQVLDEVSSDVAFDRRWVAFREELLNEPAYERPLRLLLASGVKLEALRQLALTFEQNWDLVDERVSPKEPSPPDVCALVHPVLAELRTVIALGDHCIDEDDRLLKRLLHLERLATQCEQLDEIDLMELVRMVGSSRSRWGNLNLASSAGRQEKWNGRKPEVLEGLARVQSALIDIADEVSHDAVRQLGSALRAFTLRAAEERRDAGELAFHDLLVMARALLRDPVHGSAVRERLHGRYQRLLLDEFQDTDPIQIELAARIATRDPTSDEAGSLPWTEVEVEPGHLFVVGDPKQSIYRFRRADISLFLQARNRFGDAGGQVDLVTNFRSAGSVIRWVNATFGVLIEAEEAAPGVASQPAYVELATYRPDPPGGPPVSVVGRVPHEEGSASALRRAEASDVAAAIRRIVAEEWQVEDEAVDGGWRPARLGDITILLPSRASLNFLEDALAESQIPFRAESSSLVYSSMAVRDLLMVVRAIDDPTDQLSIVSALRTPLFGCGDDDLARFKIERDGKWSYVYPQPDTVPADDPVRIALEWLHECAAQRHWSTPSELLERIATGRRAFEIGFGEGRPRDVWRRLRYVIDQARHWSEVTGGSLRQYIQWVDRQTAEGARVAEAVLPETDDDAVRVMTIHAAKGLEFPIAIVSGMSTQVQAMPSQAEVAFPPNGGVGYRLGKHVVTDAFSEWKPIDEQMGYHERIRLLYVACTRARDHLVVSLHRLAKSNPERKRTAAELLCAGMGEDVLARIDELVAEDVPSPAPRPVAVPQPPPPFEEWQAELRSALQVASRPSTIAATALTDEGGLDADPEVTDGLEKRPRDMDQPPWLKGRYGSAVGRAVHGVLQTVDLATGDGAAHAIAAQCQAEAIPDRIDTVTKLVGDALGAFLVRDAAGRAYWREVYACTPVGDRLLEGYIDLLYRTDDGLVVVDYKTAATNDPAQLQARVEGYRLQGASYAIAVERSPGETVRRVVFLFLTPGGAVELELSQLEDVKAEVERHVAEGAELVVP